MQNHDHRLIAALKRQPVDRTPIWLMRQAGRYLPEYRKIRHSVKDFLTLCKTPELAAEVTLQPIKRFALDAAIIFSDILTIPDAYGLELSFVEGEGPKFQYPVRTESDVSKLRKIDPEQDLGYVMEAIKYTAEGLQDKIPIIGFAGSPWTTATYMVEGQASKSFAIIKKMRYQAPELLHKILSHLSESMVSYLDAQVIAGAKVLMLFDTWGGILSHKDYLEFSLDYMQGIHRSLLQKWQQRNQSIPMIFFTKNSGPYLNDLLQSGATAIGLDWTIDLRTARKLAQNKVALQGNLDPAILYANDPAEIQTAVATVLEDYGSGPGHIFNLGHGMLPDVDPEKVSILIEAVHQQSPRYHTSTEDLLFHREQQL